MPQYASAQQRASDIPKHPHNAHHETSISTCGSADRAALFSRFLSAKSSKRENDADTEVVDLHLENMVRSAGRRWPGEVYRGRRFNLRLWSYYSYRHGRREWLVLTMSACSLLVIVIVIKLFYLGDRKRSESRVGGCSRGRVN